MNTYKTAIGKFHENTVLIFMPESMTLSSHTILFEFDVVHLPQKKKLKSEKRSRTNVKRSNIDRNLIIVGGCVLWVDLFECYKEEQESYSMYLFPLYTNVYFYIFEDEDVFIFMYLLEILKSTTHKHVLL